MMRSWLRGLSPDQREAPRRVLRGQAARPTTPATQHRIDNMVGEDMKSARADSDRRMVKARITYRVVESSGSSRPDGRRVLMPTCRQLQWTDDSIPPRRKEWSKSWIARTNAGKGESKRCKCAMMGRHAVEVKPRRRKNWLRQDFRVVVFPFVERFPHTISRTLARPLLCGERDTSKRG